MNLEQQVGNLWDQAIENGLCDSENIAFETFLGAHYARRVLTNQCTLTPEGVKVVEAARDALNNLLEELEEDDDE